MHLISIRCSLLCWSVGLSVSGLARQGLSTHIQHGARATVLCASLVVDKNRLWLARALTRLTHGDVETADWQHGGLSVLVACEMEKRHRTRRQSLGPLHSRRGRAQGRKTEMANFIKYRCRCVGFSRLGISRDVLWYIVVGKCNCELCRVLQYLL